MMDQFGTAIVAMVQEAAERSNDTWARTAITANELSCQLRTTEDRINRRRLDGWGLAPRIVALACWLLDDALYG
jgi:hypothetical protein